MVLVATEGEQELYKYNDSVKTTAHIPNKCSTPQRTWKKGSGPNRGRIPMVWGAFLSAHPFVHFQDWLAGPHAWLAEWAAGLAGWTSGLADWASDLARWLALRPDWLALGPDWLGLGGGS